MVSGAQPCNQPGTNDSNRACTVLAILMGARAHNMRLLQQSFLLDAASRQQWACDMLDLHMLTTLDLLLLLIGCWAAIIHTPSFKAIVTSCC